jgi:hypothetical protein
VIELHLVDPLVEPELLDPELDEPEPVDGVLVDVEGELGVDVEGGVVDVEGGVVDVEGGVVDVEGGGVDVDGWVNPFRVEDSELVVVEGVEVLNDDGVDINVGVGVLRLTFMGLKVV